MERYSVLLLMTLVVAANAGPLNVRKKTCIETCPLSSGSSKFNFEQGKAYSFDYVSDTQTKLSNDPKQTTGLRVKAKANFEMVSGCEMVLKLEQAILEELLPSDGKTFIRSPNTRRFQEALQTNDLHFAFVDGAISHICAHKDEPSWVLNVKRGIISMIQNTMPSLNGPHQGSELDVAGDCKVRYSTSMDEASSVVIKRQKDLLTCTGRQSHRSSIQSMPYFVRSDTQSMPFTLSSHSCQQVIKHGRFQKVECSEIHRLRSFNRGQSGARTKVSQLLTFVKESTSTSRSHLHPHHRRTSLVFDFEKKATDSRQEVNDILIVLADICARYREDVRPETTKIFTELVYQLRRLDEKQLRKLYSIVDRRKACRTNNDFIRRLFLDAIPMLGNAHSMAIMKDMIIGDKVSNLEANLWLTSLAFVQKPNIKMLSYLRPLLDEKEPRKQAVLGLSSMVHQYCQGRQECHTEPEIQAIGRALRRFLHGDCSSVTPEQETQILVAIKAIGNTGVLSFISNDLVRCAKRVENSMAVRVAATQAFRRMDCSVDRKPFMDIYKDINVDSELRINAYLTIMGCPTEEVVEAVKNQLAAEKVNQVGSFVWTHLTNLAETDDPTEKSIKEIIEDITLKKEFQLDKLKFSRNVEKSIFFNSINAGGRFDSNLIWSPKSFIPRSASLNLTTYLFGQSYNFFEIDGRVEGLETLLERYFGPDGYFRSGSKKPQPSKESALNAKDFKFMDNKFKLQTDRLRASMGFKIFGQEVGFFELLEEAKNDGQKFNFLEVLIKLASNQEFEWRKNFMFLDSTVTIPTIAGLPLELSINGTVSMALKAKGKLDIRRLVSWPTTFDIDGTLMPSGAVEISAMMGVDAYYSRYGMKMVSNVHTSTQLDAKLKAKNSETFDVDFKMPREKQEIVNFDTKFFLVHRSNELEAPTSGRRFNYKLCTGNRAAKFLGAELCANIQGHRSNSLRQAMVAPIASPFSASIILHKRDTHSSYRLSAKWMKTKHHLKSGNVFSRAIRFEVDTPNSRHSRRHLINFELDSLKRRVQFHIECQKRRIGFSAAFTNQANHKQFLARFFKDETTYFNVNFDGRVERDGDQLTFKPSVKVMIPGLPSISLNTEFMRSRKARSFKIVLNNLLREPLSATGIISASKKGLETSLSTNFMFKSHFFVWNHEGMVRTAPNKANLWSIRARYAKTQAQFDSNPHTAFLSGRNKVVRGLNSTIAIFDFEHRLTQFPQCRSKLHLSVKVRSYNLHIITKANYGMRLDKKIYSVIKMAAAKNKNNGITLYTTASLVFPRKGINSFTKLTVVTSPYSGEIDMLVTRRPNEETLKLRYRVEMMKTRQFQIRSNLSATVLKRYNLLWDLKLSQDEAKVYHLTTNGNFNGRSMKAVGTYKSTSRLQHSVSSTVNYGSSEEIAVDFNTDLKPTNPVVEIMAKRNGQAHSVTGTYNFKNTENQMALDYEAEASCPQRKVRITGSVTNEESNIKTNFACAWDVDRDDTRVMIFEGSFLRENDGSKRTTQLDLSVKHPARNAHVQVGFEKEDLKGSVHMELQYAPAKRFVMDSMYEIDDGWTQKGLLASITVKTPFENFEKTHVGINLFGQLRYRKAELTVLYGKNKRIVTTLIVRPQGGTNFLATLKVVTPFPRYSFMKFHLKNVVTGTQIQSELISEFGTKKTFVQVVGVNNGDYYANDLALAVSMTSPFASFRDLTLTLDHKDDSSQYNSNMEFKWNKDKKITASANFLYVRNGIDITTSGELRFTSPMEDYKRGGISWQHQNTKSMVKSELTVEYKPDARASMSLNGFVTSPEAGSLRIIGNSKVSAPGGEVSAKFSHHHTKKSLNLMTSVEMPGSRLYELDVSGKNTPSRVDGSISVDTPHDGYRKIGASFDLTSDTRSKNFESEVYCGNTKVAIASLRGKLTLPSSSDPSLVFTGKFTSSIVRYVEISARHQHTLTKKDFNSLSEVKLSGRTITVTNNVGFGKGIKYKTIIGTSFPVLRSLVFGVEHEGTIKKFTHTHFASYNTNFDLQTRIAYEAVKSLIAQSKLNFRGLHSLQISHLKTADTYETTAVATFATTKTVDFSSRIAMKPKLLVEMKLSIPFKYIRAASARVEAEGSALKDASAPIAQILTVLTYTFGDKMFNLNGILNMKSTDDIRATVTMNTPITNARDVSVVLRHSRRGPEYTSSLIGKTEMGRIEVSNIFQKVGTLKNKLSIKTPFKALKSITAHFEHRGSFPKFSHKHRLAFDAAGIKADLDNKFDVFNLRLIEIGTSFRSNIKNAQKAGFRFTFDKPITGIETGVLVEWPTNKLEGRIAFKSSPEKKVQLKISTPFYYFKELQGLYKLGNKGIKNFNHQIILAFKNDILTVGVENSLTVQSLGYVDAQLKINTPLADFKSFGVSYHHEMLKRAKRAEVKGEYNGKKYLLKGIYSDMPVHTVDMTLETPHKNFKSISTRHELSLKDAMNWKLATEYYHAELNDRLTSTLETKKEPNKLSGGYQLNRNGKIIADAKYDVSWEDKKRYGVTLTIMHNKLPKNLKTGQLIVLEGSVDIRKAISIRATLRTPFKKAENQWITVKFDRNEFLKADTMKTGNLIAEGSALGKEVMLRVSYSYGKRPSFTINLKLPDRQEMKLESSLIISDSNSFFKMGMTAPDYFPRPWNLIVDVTTAKTIAIAIRLDTTIKKFETSTARATISRHDKYIKVNGRLSMPTLKKPIEFEIENDRSTGFRAAVALRGPYVRYFRASFDFGGTLKDFNLKTEVFSVYLTSAFITSLRFKAVNGFTIEGTLKAPLTYLKSMSLEAGVVKSEKRGFIEVSHYLLKNVIRAEGKVDYTKEKFDGSFTLKTPFKKAELTKVSLVFVKSGYKVQTKIDVMSSAMKGPMSGNINFNYAKPKVDLTVKLSTPFEIVKETSMNLVLLLQRDVNGKIEITHNKLSDRIVGRIDVQFPKAIQLELTTPFDGPFKHVILSTVYEKGSPFSLTATAKYYPAHVISATLRGQVKLPLIFFNYNIATPYDMMLQTYGAVKMSVEKNFLLEATAYHNKLKEKITLSVQADDADTKTIRIRFNSPLDGPLKDVGVKLFLTKKADAFSFVKAFKIPRTFSIGASISYHQGKEISFVTSIHAPSWKKWNVKVKFATPFEIMKKTNIKAEFDIEKNILTALNIAHSKMSEPIETRLFVDLDSMKLFYTLATPFKGPHKKISVEGVVKKVGELYSYDTSLEYYNGKRITLTGKTRPKKTDFFVTFQLKTPFEKVKDVSGRLNFKPESSPIITYEISHYKFSKKIEGTFDYALMKRLRATLKTPFKGIWEDMLFDVSVKKVGKTDTYTTQLKYSPDKKYTAVLVYKKEDKSVDTSFTVTTPFEVMKKMEAKLNASWKDKVVAVAEVSHNKLSDSIHTEISFAKANPLLLEVSITTPFKKVSNLDLKVSYNKKDKKHTSTITFIYNKSRTYELHGYLKNEKNDKEITLGIQTPHKGIWKAMTFNGAYKKVAKKYNLHMKFIYKGVKTIEFNGATNTDPKNMEVDLSLTTPYKIMEKTEARFIFKMLDASYVRSTSNLKFVSSLTFFHSKLFEGRKVILSSKGTLKPNEKSLEVSLQTKKLYKAEVYYKKVGNKYSVGASAVTDIPSRPWLVQADITFNSITDFNLEGKVTCPLHRKQTGAPGMFTVKVSHKGDSKAFENSMKVTSPYHNSFSYAGKLSAGPVAEFSMEGPLFKVKKMTLRHSGSIEKFSTSATVTLKDASSIDFTSKGGVTKGNLMLDASLKTPFKKFEKTNLFISFNTNMLKQASRFSTIEIHLQSTHYGEVKFSNVIRIEKGSYTCVNALTVALKAVMKMDETWTSTLKVTGLKPEESKATLTLTSKKWKENVDLMLSWKKASDSLTVQGKLSAIKDFLKGEFQLNLPKMTPSESDATFTLSAKKLKEPVKVNIMWKKTATSFEANVESAVPVKFMKSKITINIPKMKAEESDATLKITSTDLKEPVSLKINWKKGSFMGSIEMSAPVKFMKSKISIDIPKMKAEESDATLTITSTDLKEPIKMKVNWKKTSDSFEGAVESSVPFKNTKSISFDMISKTKISVKIPKMKAGASDATVEITSKTLKEPLRASVSWEKTPKSFKAKIASSSQWDKSEASVTVDPMTKDETSVEAVVKNSALKGPLTLKFFRKTTSTAAKITLSLRTSFEKVKEIDLVFEGVKVRKQQYKGSLMASANALGSITSKMNFDYGGEKEFDAIVQSALNARRYRRAIEKVFAVTAKSSKGKHSITIEVPKAKPVKKISLTVIQSDKKLNAEASWDSKKVTVEIEKTKKYTFATKITTPFKGLEKMDVDLDIADKCCSDVSASLKVSLPKGETRYTLTWKKESSSFAVSSTLANTLIPKVPNMAIVIVHKGQLKKFTTNVDASYAKKEFKAEGSFNMIDEKSMSLTVSTPFKKFEKSSVSARFIGDKRKFSFTGDLKSSFGTGSLEIKSANQAKPTDRQTGSIKLSYNKKAYSGNYFFEGDLKSFRFGLKATPSGRRVRRSASTPWINVDITSRLQLASYEGSMKLTSKFLPAAYQTVSMTIKSDGDFKKFQKFAVKVTANALSSELFMSELKWDMGSTKSGELTFRTKSPKKGCQLSTEASFFYGSELKSSSKVEHCKNTLLEVSLQSDKKSNLMVSFKTPYKAADTKIIYKHSQPIAKSLEVVGTFENEKLGKYVGQFSAKWAKGVLADATFTMPDGKSVIVNVRQQGTAKKSTASLALTLPDKKQLKGQITYDVTLPISIDLVIETPFASAKRNQITLTFMKPPKKMLVTLKFQNTKLGQYLTSLSFDSSRSAFIVFKLETPHPEVKTLKIDFSYIGKLKKQFSQGLMGILNGKKLGYMANVNVQALLYRVVINTPFKGYETIVISNEHKGDAKAFDHAMQVEYGSKKLRMDLSHKVTGGVYNGKLRFRSHFDKLKDISLTFKGAKLGDKQWTMDHTLQYAPKRIIKSSGHLQLTLPELRAMLKIDTPFDSFRTFELKSIHTHKAHTNFNFEHRLKVNKKAGLMQGSVKKMGQKLIAFMMMETPFKKLAHLDLNVQHNGVMRNFKNEATLSWQPGTNQLRASTAFDISKPQTILSSLVVNTPWDFLRTSRFEINHSGNLRKHTQKALFEHNGRLIEYQGTVDVRDWRKMNTDHLLQTSFSKMKSMRAQFDHEKGVAHLNLFWNKMNTIKVVGLLNLEKMILAELSISSAFYNRNNAKIRLRHFTENDETTTQGIIDFNGLKTKVQLGYDRIYPGVRVVASLPHSATYDFNIAIRKMAKLFEGRVRIAKDSKEIFITETVLKFDLEKAEKSIDFKANGFLMLKGKKDAKIDFTFKGTKTAALANLKVSAINKHKIQAMVSYHNFKRVISSLKYNDKSYSLAWIYGPSADMKNAKNIAIKVTVGKKAGGLSIDFSPNELEIDLKTPFPQVKSLFMKIYHKQKNRIDFDHRSLFRLNKHRYFNFDLSVNTAKGIIKMRAPQAITVKYSMTGTRFVRCTMEIDFDKSDASKKSTIDMFLQLNGDLSSPKYNIEGFVNVKSKSRVFAIETKTTLSPATFLHKSVIRPNAGTNQAWEVYLHTLRHIAGHDRERTDEWIISTPIRQVKVFMETSKSKTFFRNDMDFYWDNKRVPSKKMGWKLKMINRNNKYSSKILFHHPLIKDGINLKTDSFIKPGIIQSAAMFSYTNNPKDAMLVRLKLNAKGLKSAVQALHASLSITQESTKLFSKLSGSFTSNRGIYVTDLSLQHRVNGKTKTFMVTTHINVLKGSLMTELVTPAGAYSVMAIGTLSSSSVTLNYQMSVDKKQRVSGNVIFNKSPSFKVRVFFSPKNVDNYVEAYGKFVNEKHLELKVHHMYNNRRFTDFIFFLKLKGEHLLKSRLFWRPTALSDVRTYVKAKLNEVRASTKALWPTFVAAVKKEFKNKVNLIKATIPNFDKLRKYSNDELELVREDLFNLGGILYNMYVGNEFYLRKIVNTLVEMAMAARSKSWTMVVSAHNHYSRSRAYAHALASRILQKYERFFKPYYLKKLKRYAKRAQIHARTLNELGRRHIYRTVEMIRPVLASMDSKYAELERKTVAAVRKSMATVGHHYVTRVHPHFVRIKTWAGDKLRAASRYHRNSKTSILDHFHEGMRSKIGEIHGNIQKKIDVLAHKYGLMFRAIRQQMNRTISQHHIDRLSFASGMIKSAIKNVQWAYDHFDVEKKLKDFGHLQYLELLDYLRENSIDVIKEYLRLDQNRFTVYQPHKGRIEGQIYLPFRLQNLRSRPDMTNFRKPMRKMYRAYKRLLPRKGPRLGFLKGMKNAVLRYVPNYETNPRAWLPAVRGYASIAGNHLITFDKVHFDLNGNCDYVLARDYKAQRWTVLLNQANGARYLSFRVYNKVFAIHKDHSVTVDGARVELPFVLGNLSIHRFGPIIKAKDQRLQFSLTSDVENDVHTLGVSKWYHGKLGGLFGNFDEEQFNDMQTTGHQLVNNVDSFIQSWAIRGCRHVNKETQVIPKGPIARKVCGFMFGCPLSSMSKCFRHIDPKPYLAMCLKDVGSDVQSSKFKVCHSAKLYVQHCLKAGVKVKVPFICRKCPVPKKSAIKEDKTIIFENNKATADVVFVVEEAPCNRDLAPKMNDVVRRLELAFRRRGMTDIRYGLVGFGRKLHGSRCARAHSHTIESQLMGPATAFKRALLNFEVEGSTEATKKQPDTLKAILTASRYPLRPGAAKHIVVVPCTGCEERRTNLDDAEDALKDQDITLHVLIEHQFKVRRPDLHPQSNYLFGVDRHSVYTQKDVRKLAGDRRLFRRVLRPMDVCSQLAYSTNGAVFNSRKLTRMHVTSQAWFSEVFAQRVASMSHSPRMVECTCTPGRWRPHLMCKKSGLVTVPMVPRELEVRPLALPMRSSARAKLDFGR